MDFEELNAIIDEIDSSIDMQLNLISLQISELKNHITTVEKLLIQLKENKPA